MARTATSSIGSAMRSAFPSYFVRSSFSFTAADVAKKPVRSVQSSLGVGVAAAMMRTHQVGALLVTDAEESRLHGILTERDILNSKIGDADRLPLKSAMTSAVTCAEPDWSLSRCLDTMIDHGFRHLPVIENGGSVPGAILSMRDICNVLVSAPDDSPALASATVGDVLEAASTRDDSIVEVAHDSSVADAVTTMQSQRTGSVLVPAHAGGSASRQAFGIFTERDYVGILAGTQVDARQAPVAEYMTSAAELVWAEPDFPALDALALLSRESFRHLPIATAVGGDTAGPTVIGVLSMREILSYVARSQR